MSTKLENLNWQLSLSNNSRRELVAKINVPTDLPAKIWNSQQQHLQAELNSELQRSENIKAKIAKSNSKTAVEMQVRSVKEVYQSTTSELIKELQDHLDETGLPIVNCSTDYQLYWTRLGFPFFHQEKKTENYSVLSIVSVDMPNINRMA